MEEPDLEALIARLKDGDAEAKEQVFNAIYQELRSIARRHLSGRTGIAGTTSLVNEVYLKMFRRPGATWADRRHFLATAARAMRQVVVDRARHRNAKKRSVRAVPIDEVIDALVAKGADMVSLDEALKRLAAKDPQLVQVIEMRFFAGYSIADTAHILEVAPRTVVRCWEVARAVLVTELGDA